MGNAFFRPAISNSVFLGSSIIGRLSVHRARKGCEPG
jgi:hypothetical protein